ncbi:MAG TPA: ribonuclease HII [Thermoanaerobaculia bacterium]|nr:ribonuclease HII [Thermoanaerobaculia bacterium]
MAESYRLRLLRGLEAMLAGDGCHRVAGVDEAGRGCLAGPVVAAAVLVDPRRAVPGVDDSKRLGTEERLGLERAIRSSALAVGCAAVSAEVIDRVNVLEATRLAMVRALEGLEPPVDVVLVDAVPLRWHRPCIPLVRGDAWSYAIACASILAKCERDRLMAGYDREYPGYGFASHKGYAAPEHRAALSELGPSPIHRLTFRSVIPRRPSAGSEG